MTTDAKCVDGRRAAVEVRPLGTVWWRRVPPAALPAAVALLVGAVTIARQPLSWDEAITASVAQRSLPQIVALIRHTDSPLTFYYVLMHGWTALGASLGAHGAVWLRLPSLIGAVAACAGLTVLMSRWFSPRLGMLAGSLLAVQPLLQFYALDARPYALVTAAVVGSVALADRALTTGGRRRWVAWTASVIGVGYLHLFALPAVAVAGLALGRRRPGSWRAMRYALLAVALALGPLLVLASTQTAEVAWIPAPSISGTLRVLEHAVGGPAVLAALVLCVAPLVRPARIRRGWGTLRTSPMPYEALLWAWALVPPVLLSAANIVTPALVARYLLVCAPAWCALAAVGLQRWRRIVPASSFRVVLAGVVACSLVTVGVQALRPYKYEDYRTAADVLGDRLHRGDVVVFAPLTYQLGFAAYSRVETDDPSVVAFDAARGGAAVPTLAGRRADPAVVEQRVSRAHELFVVGDPVGVARFGTPRDRVRVWSARYGDLVLVEFGRSVRR